MRFHEPAICLKTSDYSETSQVLHFLTRGSGVVRLLAKGTKRAKSKSGGAVDLLSEGDLVGVASSRGALGTLMEFTEAVTHRDLRRDAGRLNAAVYMLELSDAMLAEQDPHEELFDLLHNSLARLGASDAPLAVLAYFQWRLLKIVGLLGQMTACVACGTELAAVPKAQANPAPAEAWFSSIQGGLLCAGCHGNVAAGQKVRVSAAALAGLAVLAAVEVGRRLPLGPEAARAANRLLAYHAGHLLGKPLRMARHAF